MVTKGKEKNKSVFICFFAVYLFLIPFDFFAIIPNVSLSSLIVTLPLFGFVMELPKFRSINQNSFPLFLYPFAVFISTLLSVNQGSSSHNRLIPIIMNIGIVVLFTMRTYTKEELQFLLKSVAFSGWLLVGMAILYSDFSYAYGRMTIMINGQVQDPNYLCGFLFL